MRAIAFTNQKGGVGKTTSAVNVAAALARSGQRVLLVDLDPQSHASLHLGIQPTAGDLTVYDVLVHGAALAEVLRCAEERLTVAPSNIDLVGAEVELAGQPQREYCLRRALEPHRENFDVVIVDCSPSLGLLTVNALTAVDEAIIPLQPHFLALHGLGRLLETITLVRAGLNPALRVLGVVLCMFERGTRLAQEVLDDVTDFFGRAQPGQAWHGARVFQTTVRRNIKLAECPSFGRSIFSYAPLSHGAEDYAALAHEILDGWPAAREGAPAPKAGELPPETLDAARVVAPGSTRDLASAPAEPQPAAAEQCRPQVCEDVHAAGTCRPQD